MFIQGPPYIFKFYCGSPTFICLPTFPSSMFILWPTSILESIIRISMWSLKPFKTNLWAILVLISHESGKAYSNFLHCKPIPVMKTGFYLWSFSRRKTCFHYRDLCKENRVPCNANRFFPVRKTSQGKPCFNYRDGFAVCRLSSKLPPLKYILWITSSELLPLNYVLRNVSSKLRPLNLFPLY